MQKNDFNDKKYPSALAGFQNLLALGKSEITAESQFRIAEILFLTGKLDESEKTCFEVIKKYGSYTYWVTKSYLLAGDIYFTQKDFFNAEATFKSIAENSIIPELKAEATNKLNAVLSEKSKIN